MDEQVLKLGGLTVRAVGPASAKGAVLLCHGYGAPGDDLVPLAEAVDPAGTYRWLFPEAPLDLFSQGIPGRAWWPIDMMRLQLLLMTGRAQQLLEETPAGLAEARAALEGALDALEREHGLARNRLIIGGFSQGAMLTTELALHADRPFAGLAVISGTLISLPRWAEAAKAHAPGLQVLQSHGQRDPILPFAGAEGLRDLLRGAGAQLEFVEHGGGHEIPGRVLQRLQAFVRARLG